MAEERPGGEPTEPPSEKKLRDARRRGEVAKSREVTALGVFAAGAMALAWTWPGLLGQLRQLTHDCLAQAPLGILSPMAGLELGMRTFVLTAGPVLLAALLCGVLASLAQTGPLCSLHPIKPTLQRLNPLANARNIFGKQALVELIKSLCKLGAVGFVAGQALWQQLPTVLSTLRASPEAAAAAVAGCLGSVAWRVILVMVVIAAADLLYQRYAFFKRLRMTRVEVQREQKESEGDPQRKAERRRLHREILEQQMLAQVERADCVIVNPEHVAVAVCYDEKTMRAPKVVARGRRLLAAKIREIARRRGIPIIRNVPLARALCELELDSEVPMELYEAMAEVIRFVHRLSR